MSLALLERELTYWLRSICKNPKLRVKDIAEWSSDEQTVRRSKGADETVIFAPQMGLWAAVKTASVKRPIPGAVGRGGYAGVEQE